MFLFGISPRRESDFIVCMEICPRRLCQDKRSISAYDNSFIVLALTWMDDCDFGVTFVDVCEGHILQYAKESFPEFLFLFL